MGHLLAHKDKSWRDNKVQKYHFLGPTGKDNPNIKKKFKEIKAKNDPLRIQVYNQYLNIAPTNQNRLMLAYGIKEGKMIMIFFKPKVQQPQSTTNYFKTNFEVMGKDIHPLDQIELHKQTGEMVYSTLTTKAIMAERLENSLNNTTSQLQLEKASSQAKDNRIKYLEELIIGFVHDRNDVKDV